MEEYEWPPLESDPNVFNNYFHSMGLPLCVEFTGLTKIDDDSIKIVPHVLAIILVKHQIDQETNTTFTDSVYFMQ